MALPLLMIHSSLLQGVIPGGRVGGHDLELLANNFFPRDFHTPNIRTDVEKKNKSIYYSNQLLTYSV